MTEPFLYLLAASATPALAGDAPTPEPLQTPPPLVLPEPDLLDQVVPDFMAWIDAMTARAEGGLGAAAADLDIIAHELLGRASEDEGISGTMRGGGACELPPDGVLLPRPGTIRVGDGGDALFAGPVRRAWLEEQPPCAAGRRCEKVTLKSQPSGVEGRSAVPLPHLREGGWTLNIRTTGGEGACVPFEVRAPDLGEEATLSAWPPGARVVWLGGKKRLWDVQAQAMQLTESEEEVRRLVGLTACAWGLEPDVLGAEGETCAAWRRGR